MQIRVLVGVLHRNKMDDLFFASKKQLKAAKKIMSNCRRTKGAYSNRIAVRTTTGDHGITIQINKSFPLNCFYKLNSATW